MELTVLTPIDIEETKVVKEKDIQYAIEQNLSVLDEGLEFIATEVTIGTGRIDTLAYDSETSRAVFIEYKGLGAFSTNALIQLMDYLSWFVRDENRMLVLERFVKQHRPDIEFLAGDIALICVVADIEDRVRNAIYAIANNVKIFTYGIAKDTAGKLVLLPKLEVDNSVVETPQPQSVTEDDLLKKYAQFADVYRKLRPHLVTNGVQLLVTRGLVRFRKSRPFARVRFRPKQNHLRLVLCTGSGAITDPEFTYNANEPNWGRIHLDPSASIPPKVIDWIERARAFTSQLVTSVEEDVEEQSSS